MRLIYAATGDIAVPAFRYLLEHGPKPLALVTQPDKPVGRKQVLTPPMIKTVALEAGVPVLQPERAEDAVEELAALEPEVVVVMAYGQILREGFLNLAEQAIINLHASLLPKYRGAACIQAAIDAGDAETGITSLHVVRKLDAGDIILKKRLAIGPEDTGGVIHDRLAVLAAEVLAETLELIAGGGAVREPQVEAESSYISKLERSDGRIDWTMPAEEIERRIRAYDPWPGTYTMAEEGGKSKRLKIFPQTKVVTAALEPGEISAGERLVVGCGAGALELVTVQPDGGKRMGAEDYQRGRKPVRFS
ncbi:MAG: methionyl-tRNA formyltransferase [Verrucomicrobiales bacterium]|nr:methionyl-tRNA formyltransferase [Verrucomicrobiota bacterium JB025]